MRYLILIFLLISGCAYNDSFMRKDFDYTYEKKKDYYLCNHLPQYHDLKDNISKQEYRMLPSYLQECYEKKEQLWTDN